MIGLIGCALGFTLGAGCVVLCFRIFGGGGDDLRGQWEEFLNYK